MKGIMVVLSLIFFGIARADYNRGVDYYSNGQYKQAFAEFQVDAGKGHAEAQAILGSLYDFGRGTRQDSRQALAWYRKAAKQGSALALRNLGQMYLDGRGVVQDNATAYALLSLARAQGEGPAAVIMSTRDFSDQEVEQGQRLVRELSSPDTFIAALDANDKRLASLQPSRGESVTEAPAESSTTPYPPKPAKRPGVLSCNTQCENGDCYRTYDNGKRKHFQARQKYNPLSGHWEWDAGSC